MKKIFATIILLLVVSLFLSTNLSFAANTTPTSAVDQALLDEIASTSAQLHLTEKRGIVGTVTDSSGTQITLNDINGNTRFVDVDELTKFSSPKSSSYGFSDITKGTLLGVLGLYNKDTRRILARDVTVMNPFPNVIYGTIGAIDKVNYEVTIIKSNKEKAVAEIQDVTKTYSFSGGTLVKAGFSKVENAETIIAIGFPDKQDSSKLLATKIILLPDIQTNFAVNILPQSNPTLPPSTGSGMKLYPITK
jgi:hypothetical protein